MSAIPIMVSLLGNAAGFIQAVNGAKGNLDNFASSLARSRAMMGTLGVTAAGAGFVSLGQSIFKAHERFEAIAIGLKLTTGSLQGSREEMEFVRTEADRLGLSFLDLAHGYKNLTASTTETSLAGQKTRNIFSSLMEAATVYRLSMDDVSGVMRAMTQIMSKGTVQTEDLNQVAERMPGVFSAAAKSMGMDTKTLRKELELGKVDSIKFIESYAGAMRALVEGELPDAIKTGTAELGRLRTAWDNFLINLGKTGIVDNMGKSMSGLAEAIDFVSKSMNGRLGDTYIQDIESADPKLNALTKKWIQLNYHIAETERLIPLAKRAKDSWFGSGKETNDLYFQFERLNEIINHGKKEWPKTFEHVTEEIKMAKDQSNAMLSVIAGMGKSLEKSEFEKNKKKAAPKEKREILTDDKVKFSVETEIMLEEESKSLDEFSRKIKEAEQAYKKLVETPSDKFQEDIEKMHLLFQRGKMSPDEFINGVHKAHDEMTGFAEKVKEAEQAYKDLMSTPADEFAEQIQKFYLLAERGKISWDEFGKAAETAHIKMFESGNESYKKLQEAQLQFFQGVQSGFESAIYNFISMKDAASGFFIEVEHRAMTLKTLFADVYNSIVSEFLGMLAKMAAQMLANTLFGEKMKALQAATSVALGNTITAAMTPAAITTSIATEGTASAVGFTAFQSAVLAAKGMMLAGVAHGGLDEVPREGTYLLDGGEGVIKADQNKSLRNFLKENEGGRGNNENQSSQNVYNIRVVLNSQSIDSRGMDAVAKTIAPSIMREMRKTKRNQLRSSS